MDKFEEQILWAIKNGLMFSIRDSQIVSILMSDIKDEISELLYAHCNMVQDESEQNAGTEINVNYGSGEKDEEKRRDMMEFPTSFDEFAKQYAFKDIEKFYTNGSDLIPVFRVKQWLEQDNKLRKMEIETAHECGKHANGWIPISEDWPETTGLYLVSIGDLVTVKLFDGHHFLTNGFYGFVPDAWMPLPKTYKAGELTVSII